MFRPIVTPFDNSGWNQVTGESLSSDPPRTKEVIRRTIQLWLSRNNQQDAACNRIYYSKIYWRLNMFRAAHRSSSGALNCICSLWFIYTYGDRPFSKLGGNPAWTTVGHHMGIYTRGCKYSFELLMMSGILLETCWAFNKFWNNKFYYKVASCWLFLLTHTAMHGSMNINP